MVASRERAARWVLLTEPAGSTLSSATQTGGAMISHTPASAEHVRDRDTLRTCWLAHCGQGTAEVTATGALAPRTSWECHEICGCDAAMELASGSSALPRQSLARRRNAPCRRASTHCSIQIVARRAHLSAQLVGTSGRQTVTVAHSCLRSWGCACAGAPGSSGLLHYTLALGVCILAQRPCLLPCLRSR